jgi:hypothetical protein
MLRKLAWLLPLVALVLIGAMTVSCSSSSSSSTVNPNCTGGPYDIVGNWQITVTPSGVTPVIGYGAIDSAGLAVFFDFDAASGDTGGTLQLPALTGACYFTGNIVSSPLPSSEAPTVSDTLQGNVVSATSITGTFSGASSGTIAAIPFTPLSGSPTALTGALKGLPQGITDTLSLTFSATNPGASMNFTGVDTNGCTITGSFTQVGGSNVFDVTYNVTGGPVSCSATSSTGIGFESNTDYFNVNNGAAGTYLYADILAGGPYVIEMYQ